MKLNEHEIHETYEKALGLPSLAAVSVAQRSYANSKRLGLVQREITIELKRGKGYYTQMYSERVASIQVFLRQSLPALYEVKEAGRWLDWYEPEAGRLASSCYFSFKTFDDFMEDLKPRPIPQFMKDFLNI